MKSMWSRAMQLLGPHGYEERVNGRMVQVQVTSEREKQRERARERERERERERASFFVPRGVIYSYIFQAWKRPKLFQNDQTISYFLQDFDGFTLPS